MVRIMTIVAANLIRGWLFMIAVGVAHAEWVPALPTIGYMWAVTITTLVGAAFERLPEDTL